MPTQLLPYSQTGYFSKLITDYLAQSEPLNPFYDRFPTLGHAELQMEVKKSSYTDSNREVLVAQLEHQNKGIQLSELTQFHLEQLRSSNGFTITTGHQLNLFTGPLYFLYKIISVINFCKALGQKYPKAHFIPVYWMATEDHDFEEINFFRFKGKKIVWDRTAGGAVGELTTEGLEEVVEFMKTEFGTSQSASSLVELFKKAYLGHDNLADATRYLANELFGAQGLVILDGNDPKLKALFAPYVKEELVNGVCHSRVAETTEKLVDTGYHEQVHPREINLFYLSPGLRERIIKEGDQFAINNTQRTFSEAALLEELDQHPERFSPNALMRPLYQEVILPNLCYIGGGGELAYWFQLKAYFEAVEVPFPMLMLRNSAVVLSYKIDKKLKKLDVAIASLFQKKHELEAWYTKQQSEIKIDFSTQREHLKKQFEAMYDLAAQTDRSFLGAVGAQEKKQLNGLDHLEKRLLKAQKRRMRDRLDRLAQIQEHLFPDENLQERVHNFSELYLEYGSEITEKLMDVLDPIASQFTVLTFPSTSI